MFLLLFLFVSTVVFSTHAPTTTFCSTCSPVNYTCVVLPYTNNCVGAFDLEFLLTWDTPDLDHYGLDMYVFTPLGHQTSWLLANPIAENDYGRWDVNDEPHGVQPNGPENVYYSFAETGHYPPDGNYTICAQPSGWGNATLTETVFHLTVKVNGDPFLQLTGTFQLYPLPSPMNELCATVFGGTAGVTLVTTFEYTRGMTHSPVITPAPTTAPTSPIDMTGPIVGLSIGIPILVAALLYLLVLDCLPKRKR